MELSHRKRNVRVNTGLHSVAHGLLSGLVVWMVAVSWFFFAADSYSALQIAVVAGFAAAFLFVPLWASRISGARSVGGSFKEWFDGDLEVRDGAIPAGHALAMIMCAHVAGVAGITGVSFFAWLAAAGAL